MLKTTHDKLVAALRQDRKDADNRGDAGEFRACGRALATLRDIKKEGFTDGNDSKV